MIACGDSSGSIDDATTASDGTSAQVTGSSSDGTTGAQDTGGTDWRRICDGSDQLRMVVRGEVDSCELTCLLTDLGARYLYVRGDCTYWANIWTADVPWSDTKTGVLTLEQEEALSRQLHYDRWPELAGVYLTGQDLGFPGGRVYSDGEATIACAYGCQEDILGPEVLVELSRPVNDLIRELWDAGESLPDTAPMRVDVFGSTGVVPPLDDPEACAAVWPFDIDPDAWARWEDDTLTTQSILVDDPDLAAQLREVRRLYRDGPVPLADCDPLRVGLELTFYEEQDPSTGYLLWTRDALPMEEPDGGVSVPPPPQN